MFRTFGKSAGHRSICLDGTIAAGDHGTKPLLKSRAVHMLEERRGLNHPSAERRKEFGPWRGNRRPIPLRNSPLPFQRRGKSSPVHEHPHSGDVTAWVRRVAEDHVADRQRPEGLRRFECCPMTTPLNTESVLEGGLLPGVAYGIPGQTTGFNLTVPKLLAATS